MARLSVLLKCALVAAMLNGCAAFSPDSSPAVAVDSRLPAAWSAPLPHGGDNAALTQWWSQFDDPLLTQLIAAAQQNNGSLTQAAARIEQARAHERIARGGAEPTLNARAGLSRDHAELPLQYTRSTTSIGLDAAWEIDVFGVTRSQTAAAAARVEGAVANWHELRVTLAAEVAANYVGYRSCEALAELSAQTSQSQRRSSELTQAKLAAGFENQSNAALARAGAIDASNRAVEQRADCGVLQKGMVALTALPEDSLRTMLAARAGQLPQPRAFTVEATPAHWLRQRPDLAALEREIAAASNDVGAALADRFPRLSLSGTITGLRLKSANDVATATQWSIGPALSLPLFDAGRRAARADLAQAQYREARAKYEQRCREAVREVEEALLRLDASGRREADALRAVFDVRQFMESTEARWKIGMASLLELEEARRVALGAAENLARIKRERVVAWIALYKAIGGGWDAQTPETAPRV